MQQPLQIIIPNPCTQDWDAMTPAPNGRHCAHCQKTVIDFTGWTDAALYNYFAANKGPTCGHFFAAQLNRPVTLPYQPHSRLYRIAAAMGFTLLLSQAPRAMAQTRPPQIAQGAVPALPLPKGDTATGIKGVVFDHTKQTLPSATVKVFQNGVLKGMDITDIDGNFMIHSLDAGRYEVRVVYAGEKDTMVEVLVTEGKMASIGVTLQAQAQLTEKHAGNFVNRGADPRHLPYAILGAFIITQSCHFNEPGHNTFYREEINQLPMR